ncbi:MAG: DNA translocase FtsK [Ruminiclostridium sp.]|nr:DNA translocase FtsK [Ruminiclostridium sp.]
MKNDNVSIGGISLAGLGAAALLWPAAPAWLVPVSVGGGIGLCALGWWLNHYTDLERLFLNCGLFIHTISDTILVPKKIKTIKKNNGRDYILSLPKGLSLQQFKDKEAHISQALDKHVRFDFNNGILIMSIKDTKLQKTYPFTAIHTEGALELVLGYGYDGLIKLDLAAAPSPHILIAGETNSGKSVVLRDIITQLILDKNPEELELYLIDPKRVEFSIFKKCAMVKAFVREDDEITDLLILIKCETDRRYELLERAGYTNIRAFNKKAKQKLKYMLVIVDEFADLAENRDIIDLVNYVARKARAVGVNLILSTQRPDKDVLTGKIRSNIGNVLGLKTSTRVNSEVVIGQSGLENLRGFGHSLLKCGSDLTELQSMLLSEEAAKKLIKHTFVEKSVRQGKARGYIDGYQK